MRIRQLLLFLLGLCVVLPSAALGDPVFLETKSDSVGSTLLKQKRQIEVYLPSESAKDSSGRYQIAIFETAPSVWPRGIRSKTSSH